MPDAKKKPVNAVQTIDKPAAKKLSAPLVKPAQPPPGTGGNGDV